MFVMRIRRANEIMDTKQLSTSAGILDTVIFLDNTWRNFHNMGMGKI